MSHNGLDLCEGVYATWISGAQQCDFTFQAGLCGSCASSWTQCSVSETEVACEEPSTSGTGPEEEKSNSSTSVVPLVHCWEMLEGEVYGYFGYETTISTEVSQALVNVTNGRVEISPETMFETGRWPLTIVIEVENASHPVSIQMGLGEVQKLEISESTKCPNISLEIGVSYPNATNMGNLTEEVHDLYVAWVPYPAELLTVENVQKRVLGDLSLLFAPNASYSTYTASALLLGRPLPSNQVTGNAAGSASLKTPIPTSGGSLPPTSGPALPSPSPIRPPSFTASAKGAISICIIVGVLIVGFSLWLFIAKRTSSLPLVSKDKQDKSIRIKKKKLKDEEDSL